MLVLAIESSCDETAAAVVRDGREALSNVISSQVDIHAEYGGVVPEIASRKHLEAIYTVIVRALEDASVSLSQVEGVAVTQGPGLPGALLVGVSAAKAIAFAKNLPIVGIHHIEGHIFASFLEQRVEFPFLALVVSGGHTHLYRVDGFGRYITLGQTLDDAAGEAFDKVGKLLGIPYPGGAVIDKLARTGDPLAIKFPRPLIKDPALNFSFSGLKTAVLNHLQKNPGDRAEGRLNDLCASFQAAVCDVLSAKTRRAMRETGINRLVVAGGVACNSGLRQAMAKLVESEGGALHMPAPLLCTDNAAMLAVPADYYLQNGIWGELGFDSIPSWRLDTLAERVAGI